MSRDEFDSCPTLCECYITFFCFVLGINGCLSCLMIAGVWNFKLHNNSLIYLLPQINYLYNIYIYIYIDIYIHIYIYIYIHTYIYMYIYIYIYICIYTYIYMHIYITERAHCLHFNYTHLASVTFGHSVCRGWLMTIYIYIYVYILHYLKKKDFQSPSKQIWSKQIF